MVLAGALMCCYTAACAGAQKPLRADRCQNETVSARDAFVRGERSDRCASVGRLVALWRDLTTSSTGHNGTA